MIEKGFLFVGDVNAHHEERLGSFTTNLHSKTAHDFVSSLVVGRWLRSLKTLMKGCLDLVLTDVPDVVKVRVSLRVGTSDHIVISLYMLCWINLFLTWCVGRRSISRTLWTGSWLEEM